MSLSWGRRPLPERRFKRRWLLLVVPLAAIAFVLWPRPPEPPPNAILAETRGEIQAALDYHLASIARGDHDGFALTYDPERPWLARCLEADYAAARTDGPPAPEKVSAVTPVGTYDLRAVTVRADGTTSVRYFRRAGVIWNRVKPPFFIWATSWRWYLSEPRAADVAERTVRDGGIALTYPLLEGAEAAGVRSGIAAAAAEAGVATARIHWVLTLEQAPGAGCGTVSRDPSSGDVVLYRPRLTPEGSLAAGTIAALARALGGRPAQ